jgi:hypothetical protein
MYPHTATIWTKVAAGDNTTWSRTVLSEVRFEGVQGSRRLAYGDGSLDTGLVIIPFRSGVTFAAGDRIIKGRAEDTTPPEDAHHITTIDELSVGCGAIHHWEVSGK